MDKDHSDVLLFQLLFVTKDLICIFILAMHVIWDKWKCCNYWTFCCESIYQSNWKLPSFIQWRLPYNLWMFCVRFMPHCGRNLLPKFTIAAIFVPSLCLAHLSVGAIKLMVIGCNWLFFDTLLIYSNITVCFDSRALCQPLGLKIKTW